MYEMFSAQPQNVGCDSYWMLNTSKSNKRIAAAMYDIGVPINESIELYETLNTRVVGYLKKDTVISSGDGTITVPYIIK